jgi:carboxypeptidase Q
MFNVIAELRGTELPDEYVMLSAHLDSWHGATGATDNGTGTITMLEAMRILRATYPNPRRTILVGHWGGEEQGLIGSRAFTEDHPQVVENLQALFNQDNGTWRVDYIQAQGLLGASAHLAPLGGAAPHRDQPATSSSTCPGPQETGRQRPRRLPLPRRARLAAPVPLPGLPAVHLAHQPRHLRQDRLRRPANNAMLAAMLAYLASEDPERVPRDRSVLPPDPRTGQPRPWLPCAPARRG